MNSKDLKVDKGWSLLLDRDGVINRMIEGDYVRKLDQFEFLPGALEVLPTLSYVFGRVIVITNQSGIGKGLIDERDIEAINSYMVEKVSESGGKIDAVYFCPHDYNVVNCDCRKPAVGMAEKARSDFPDIDFSRSVMVGDSASDMEFGRKIGSKTVLVGGGEGIADELVDFRFADMSEFATKGIS